MLLHYKDLIDMLRLFQLGPTSTNWIQMPGNSRGQLEVVVPQRPYVPHHRHNYFNQFIPENPIVFPSCSGWDGIMLADAMNKNFDHLIGRHDPMFANYTGPAISLRLGVNSAPVYLGETRLISTRF